jgi:serine/threonine-protein kinase
VSSVYYLIDKTLGKYKVLEHIGHGGMSEVYKGQQAQLNRMVAIKVLHPFLADEEGFVVRFQREARIVATLRHPNIVQVYDFDFNEELGIYYMVMEYINGPTLKSMLENGSLTPTEMAKIGAAIANALDYAHQRGMVHRDIKPANIMFIEEQEPVLTDFGIAKMITLSGLTASGAMVGTPAYMAPEVGMGKAGTAHSDLYSLGVVLYQIVTGHLPFTSETPMGMVMQHINDAPPPPSQYVPDISPELEQVILQALEKKPEARFERASDMSKALRYAVGLDTIRDREAPLQRPRTGITTTTPGTSRASSEDRLIKTWPPASSDSQASPPTPAPDTPTEYTEMVPEPEEEQARPPLLRRLARSVLFLLFVLIIGGGIWFGVEGGVPPFVMDVLSARLPQMAPETESVETPTPSPTPTETPTPTATPTPTLTPTATPTLASIATTETTCSPRVRLDQIRIEPDETIAPGTPLVTYVTLENNSNCAWPQDIAFYFASGDQLNAPDVFPMRALEAGSTIQMIIPMQAPEELGSYRSVWEVRRNGDTKLGSNINIEITVGDVPALTPTPLAQPATPEAVVSEPLTLSDPLLLSWEEDRAQDRWTGVVEIEAQGGTGNYRYYLGEIGAATALTDNTFQVEGQRCTSAPVQLWVLSGEETLKWLGEIPYPDPQACE